MFEESQGNTAILDAQEVKEAPSTEKESTPSVSTTNENNTSREHMTLEELSHLAKETNHMISSQSSADFLSSQLGMQVDTGLSLEGRIQSYRNVQNGAMTRYLNRSEKSTTRSDNFFSILSGFNESINGFRDETNALPSFLLANHEKKTSGGYFFRWNGTGVVINPGHNFLKNFHKNGHHIRDINIVIVTSSQADNYSDLKNIYDVNYRLNTASDKLHTIGYFLNQQAYRNLAALLKPNFKQEKDTVHCLELYVDSPDMEVTQLSSDISLRYFPTHRSQENSDGTNLSNPLQMGNLGLRFELKGGSSFSPDDVTTVGYISGTSWSSSISQHLRGSDFVIAGFGNTSAEDHGKVKYQSDCLGYFGLVSLIEEVSPKLLIAAEFGGREGDIRMESTKKLRQDSAFSTKVETTILPGDTGMMIDLKTIRVHCSISDVAVEPAQIKVTKSQDDFGTLNYLSSNCLI